MSKAEFFELVEHVVGPAAVARGWVSGKEGLFVRDEGDIILAFQVLPNDMRNVVLAARVWMTSRRLNDSNLAFSQQKPVKSAKKQVMLAMGCPLSRLSVRISVEGSSWSTAGAELAQKSTEEAEKLREKYGSIEKIREFYQDLYRKGDQAGAREVLMCISMMRGNYEEALKFISEGRPNLPPDKDYTIWGYAARYARKMLDARASSSIH